MADTTETPAPVDTAADTSIADHEHAFMGEAAPPKETAEPAEPVRAPAKAAESKTNRERDASGKFVPRPAAREPVAEPSAEPVETLESVKSRLAAVEAERDALKRAPVQPTAAAKEPEPAVAQPIIPAPVRTANFPTFEEFVALKGNEAKTFEDFLDARADWRYDQRRETERAHDAAVAAVTKHQELVKAYSDQLPAVLKKYPDFQTVMAADPAKLQVSKVVERAALELGPEISYYLVTHDDERKVLSDESLVDPENSAFPAAVSAMKRYLKTLIAAEAPAPEAKPVVARPMLVPRPPSPTKTGGMPPSDEPPDDEAASIAAHEAYYGPKSGRRH